MNSRRQTVTNPYGLETPITDRGKKRKLGDTDATSVDSAWQLLGDIKRLIKDQRAQLDTSEHAQKELEDDAYISATRLKLERKG